MNDLSIHKSKRSIKYFQRGLRNGELQYTRIIAQHDISKECKNYLFYESLILSMGKYPELIISLNV